MPLCTRVRFSFSITFRFFLFLFFFLIYEFNNICVFGRSFESHVFISDKGPAMPSKHSANDDAGSERQRFKSLQGEIALINYSAWSLRRSDDCRYVLSFEFSFV